MVSLPRSLSSSSRRRPTNVLVVGKLDRQSRRRFYHCVASEREWFRTAKAQLAPTESKVEKNCRVPVSEER